MKRRIMVFLLCLIILTSYAVCNAEIGKPIMPPKPNSSAVDLDLSKLSGTVVYAQVYNMMYDYESWLGKVIKIAGYYSAYEDEGRGVVYHACVIPDATACCAQGVEFVWAGEHVWPDDYPEADTDIVVTGRLETYDEDGVLYLHLADADLKWGMNP